MTSNSHNKNIDLDLNMSDMDVKLTCFQNKLDAKFKHLHKEQEKNQRHEQ